MKKILITFLAAITLCSCSRNIGQWDDNIHLSAKKADFSSSGDSVIIKTKGNSWWVSTICVDSTYYSNFKGINLLSENYSIKQDGLIVERRDANTLFIKADANPLNVYRTIIVWLQAGDYFDSVTITQKSK